MKLSDAFAVIILGAGVTLVLMGLLAGRGCP